MGRQPASLPHAKPRLCRVSLTERGSIAERGEFIETWSVRVADAWVRAIEHPEAHLESEAESEGNAERCPSGTVWQRTTEMLLPRGTRVLQRQTWPRIRKLSVMDYLKLGIDRPGRFVREREYIVTGNYQLCPVEVPTGNTPQGPRSNATSQRSKPGAGSAQALHVATQRSGRK